MSNLVRWVCASVLLAWFIAAPIMLVPLPSSNEVILQKNRDTLQIVVAERLRKDGIDPTPARIEQETAAVVARAKSKEWVTWWAVLAVIAIGALSAVRAMRKWSRWRWPLAVTCCMYIAWLGVSILAVGVSPSQFYAMSFYAAHRSETAVQSITPALQLIVIPVLLLAGVVAAFSYRGPVIQEPKTG